MNVMRYSQPALYAASFLLISLVSACGGSGNQPPALQPIPDIVVVAGRTLPSISVRAIDLDSTLLRYSTPEFPEDQQKGLAALNIPAKSLLEFIGLNIAPITGKISGTPKTPGSYPITISVKDSEGATDSKTFNIKIIPESINLSVEVPQAGAPRLRIDAGDTSEGGTVAYCIKQGTDTPKVDDACFKSAAAGGRSTTIEIPPAGQTVTPVYLFTKDAAGNVLSAGVPSAGTKPLVLFETSKGPFVLELDTKAPKTTENFLKYVDDGFFSDTVFHRIISTFMVQGGGYVYNNGAYTPKPNVRDPIDLEKTKDSGLSNTKGTIAMARTNVESSATSQFFINVVDNSATLDAVASEDPTKVRAGYAVFGRVVPPYLGLVNDLPAAVLELMKTEVSGDFSGGTTETSKPVGAPPFIISARKIN